MTHKVPKIESLEWESAVQEIRNRSTPEEFKKLDSINPINLNPYIKDEPVIIRAPIIITEGKVCSSLYHILHKRDIHILEVSGTPFILNCPLLGMASKGFAELAKGVDEFGDPLEHVKMEDQLEATFNDLHWKEEQAVACYLQRNGLESSGLFLTGFTGFHHCIADWQWCLLLPVMIAVCSPLRKLSETLDFLIMATVSEEQDKECDIIEEMAKNIEENFKE